MRVSELAEQIKNKLTENLKESGADVGVPGDYLVVEDPKLSSTWHLRVRRDGVVDHQLMGSAFASLTIGFRGNKYQGPARAEALKKLKALYKKEKMPFPGAEGKTK